MCNLVQAQGKDFWFWFKIASSCWLEVIRWSWERLEHLVELNGEINRVEELI
jgi:hypothetical protein